MSLIKRKLNTLASAAIPVWAVGMTFVVACLMVGHWVSLPHPEAGAMLPESAQSDSASDVAEDWTAFHFLYGDCPCSRRVLKHVVSRSPIDGISERVVLIGNDEDMKQRALDCGYAVDCVDPVQLQKKYGVESAPLLIVADRAGMISYSGGYTSRKQGLDIQDVDIIERAVSGDQPTGLPLYGCAVSKSLKAIVDPLGIK